MIWNERNDKYFMPEAVTYLSIREIGNGNAPGSVTKYAVDINLVTGVSYELTTGFDNKGAAAQYIENIVHRARDKRLIRNIGVTERNTRK